MPRKSLQSPSHVKRYLSALILKVEKGEIDPQKASRIAYISNVLLHAMEITDIGDRITEIETLLEKRS
jgi:predicted transcriptional regulator